MRKIARRLRMERRDEQHAAAHVARHHVPAGLASKDEPGAQIDRQHAIPGVLAHGKNVVHLRSARTGCMHQDGKRPEPRESLLEQRCGALLCRQIGRDEVCYATLFLQ